MKPIIWLVLCIMILVVAPAAAQTPAPAGDEIAYTVPSPGGVGSDIVLQDIDAGTVTVLAPNRRVADSFAWSLDGAMLAFTDMGSGGGAYDIFVVAVDTGTVTQITNHPAQDSNPTWTPDGARLTFTSNRDSDPLVSNIYSVKPDGTDLQQLTDTNRGYNALAWSPGGDVLLAIGATERPPLFPGLQDTRNRALFALTPDDYERGDPLLESVGLPVWAPGGETIAYNAPGGVFTTDVRSRTTAQLTTVQSITARGVNPSWHGERVAFIDGTMDDGWQIVSANADGTERDILHTLDAGASLMNGVFGWSPSGETIIFGVNGGIVPEDGSAPPAPTLYLLDVASGETTVLARELANAAAWRPAQ